MPAEPYISPSKPTYNPDMARSEPWNPAYTSKLAPGQGAPTNGIASLMKRSEPWNPAYASAPDLPPGAPVYDPGMAGSEPWNPAYTNTPVPATPAPPPPPTARQRIADIMRRAQQAPVSRIPQRPAPSMQSLGLASLPAARQQWSVAPTMPRLGGFGMPNVNAGYRPAVADGAPVSRQPPMPPMRGGLETLR